MSAPAFKAMAELAAALHGVSPRSQAAQLGLSAREIATAKRHGFLAEPTPGVLVFNSHQRSWRQDLAVVLASRPTAQPSASHRASARLHRLDGFDSDLLEVSVEVPRRFVQLRGFSVVTHHVASLRACDIVQIDGLRTTGLARVLADLGSVVSEDAVWKALISARRIHRVSPIWLQQTAVRLHRPGQSGTNVLFRLLDRWAHEGQLPDSWFEELIARMVADPRIPPFVRQHVIRDDAGRHVATVDLGIPSVRVGLEAHSRQFHFGPIHEAADEDRDLRAGAVGWELAYLGWYAHRRPAEILDLIAQVCARRRREV